MTSNVQLLAVEAVGTGRGEPDRIFVFSSVKDGTYGTQEEAKARSNR